MVQYSDEQHEAWKREAATIPAERVLEVVTEEMLQHQAENGCAQKFAISIQAAVYLVGAANEAKLILQHRAKVWPAKHGSFARITRDMGARPAEEPWKKIARDWVMGSDVPVGVELPVCPDCGWHMLRGHSAECWPEAGKAADHLAQRVQVPSTKLGYGSNRITFLFGEGRSLTFNVSKEGVFTVDRLFWLDNIDESWVAAMVRSLDTVSSETK